MKIILKILIAQFIIIISFSCSNSVSPEFDERFAIYLLKEDSLRTNDVENISINKLELRSEPILTYDDIVLYDFENHKVFLRNNLSNYLGKDSTRVFSKVFGIPFILVAKGERIYLGSFLPMFSSIGLNTPTILDYTINKIEKSFIISSGGTNKKYDVRFDSRILLVIAKKLKK
ncbi:MAG: hypothetical protein IPH62_00125 [Ignavibacteriae bacterium]|nr:hypothetical protein [Ignavibacteriota bacterium]